MDLWNISYLIRYKNYNLSYFPENAGMYIHSITKPHDLVRKFQLTGASVFSEIISHVDSNKLFYAFLFFLFYLEFLAFSSLA